MTHWRTHPAAWRCQHGHAYAHPRQSNMSVFFGGASVLTTFLVCHKCQPASYQVGVIYNTKPLNLVYWYSCESRDTFDTAKEMDEQETPIEQILTYIESHEPQRAA